MRCQISRRSALSLIGSAGGSVGFASAAGVISFGRSETLPVFVDARLDRVEEIAVAPFLEGRRKLLLHAEIIRQWRDEIVRTFTNNRQLDAIVRWDHVTLLESLVRESGGRANVRRVASGLFIIRSAERPLRKEGHS